MTESAPKHQGRGLSIVRSGVIVVACLVALVLAQPADAARFADEAGTLRLPSERTESPIQLDGVLDESAWQKATVGRLVQQEPVPGGPTPYETKIRILIDAENIYIGFHCVDPDPSRIAIHTMQRDGHMWGDDTVGVVIGPFGDRRNGYLFRVNAAGARQDGLFSSSGGHGEPLEWDGIWDARAYIDDFGWSVEMVIPTRSIRFDPKLEAWELNAERSVPRDRTMLRWADHSLDARLRDLQRSGRLDGMTGLNQGKGFSFSPYVLGRYEIDHKEDTSSNEIDGGFDVEWSPSPDLTLIGTVNTDFAETEVDERRINLSRFPLFFPEKRAFFLEGSDLFKFGGNLGRDLVAFHSRRVGLYDEEIVPILAGVKVLGRSGRWSYSALDTMMDESVVSEKANLFAGRATYDATSELRLGVIATDGEPEGVRDNTMVGVDAVWRTSKFRGDKNLGASAWAMFSRGDREEDQLEGQANGWGFQFSYPNDLWDASISYKWIGDALDPGLGFLPRSGVQIIRPRLQYRPRPDIDWIRQFRWEFFADYIMDLDGRVESWSAFTAPFYIVSESGDNYEFNWRPTFDRLDEPFEIVDGVDIPVGEYRWDRFRLEVKTSSHRWWRTTASVWFGTFYTGHLTQARVSGSVSSSSGKWRFDVEALNNDGDLPEGDFTQRMYQLKTYLAFSPDLVLSLFGQFDSESENLGFNTRLRWTIKPGNDLFVVWNHDWERSVAEDRHTSFESLSDQLVVKLRITLRR
ncbi:MAG: carbohydrate binding family 9 domain-containing protein [bacterium]|nr:carbohydrate binding family 9 domain-containing protein [bacterium]